jgi:AcrR family transcriptional regulator
LSRESVVAEAATLASREGLDAVAVRSVARSLGVTPMALYRHVGDAASLRGGVIERLLEDLPDAACDPDWRGACIDWAFAARDVLARTPGLARFVLVEWVHLPRVLGALDSLVGLLEDHGPPDCDPVAAANAVLMHVLMRAQAEESVRHSGIERDLSTLRRHRHACPRLWRHRDEYRVAQIDRHFSYGIHTLLAGLAAGSAT